MKFLRSLVLLLSLATAQTVAAQETPKSETPKLLIFAAASLKGPLDEAAKAYTARTGQGIVISYAASSTLARQIEAGAPAGLAIFADQDWMDELDKKDLLVPNSRANLFHNRLVLIAPRDSVVNVDLSTASDLVRALDGARLAMGDVGAVPAGKYGKAALEKLGIWPKIADKIAPAGDVRAALALVARGEAGLGIVYRTDAFLEKSVRTVAEFPESTHVPIIYPGAAVEGKNNEGARAFLDALHTPELANFFRAAGFDVLNAR